MSDDKERDFRYLWDLMDDEHEQSASLAMAELLRTGPPDLLNERLCEFQETRNPRLRRRVHQLQSAIGARFTRSLLADDLRSGKLSLLDGAIRLHLCWFDNDRYENVWSQWDDLRDELYDARPGNIAEFGEFMVAQAFNAPNSRSELEPEYYCIGCVLDDMPGSDLILSIIAAQLTVDTPLKLRLIRSGMDFGIMDSRGNKLFPGDNWRLAPAGRGDRPAPVRDAQALRMIASSLFFCAVSTDSFRYLYTFGSALAAAAGRGFPDFLPYPYDMKDPEKQKF